LPGGYANRYDRTVADRRGAAMRLRDRCDYREPEPRARACSTLLGTAEAFESALRETLGEPASFIAHFEDEIAVILSRDGDRAATVPQSVVDEIAERLLDPKPVDMRNRVAVHFDCAPGFGHAARIAGRDAVHELVRVHVLQTKR
jgi:hypothetical protein